MRLSFLIITIIVTTLFCEDYSTNDCPVQISYKSWFLNPPQKGVTGFPLRNKKASADGFDRFCSYQRMRAKGVLRFYESNGRIKNRQDSLYFYYDPNSAVDPNELKALDSMAVTKSHKLYLYSSEEMSVNSEAMMLCASSKWDPAMESPDRTYGYGLIGLSYYDHVGSWVTSESDAIRDLLGKSAVLVASQQLSTEQNLTEVTRYEYDLLIQNIRVERRWVDFDDWSCHVVVSAPTSGISIWKADSTDPLRDKRIIPQQESVPAAEIIPDESEPLSDTVVSEPAKKSSGVAVGSKEWYKLYRDAQNRQLNRSTDSLEQAQEQFEREQNREFQNHQKESGSDL